MSGANIMFKKTCSVPFMSYTEPGARVVGGRPTQLERGPLLSDMVKLTDSRS